VLEAAGAVLVPISAEICGGSLSRSVHAVSAGITQCHPGPCWGAAISEDQAGALSAKGEAGGGVCDTDGIAWLGVSVNRVPSV